MAYKDPDKQREFQALWRTKRRQEFIESRGGVCEKCKSIDRLEVDHIDRSLKTMRATALWSRSDEVRNKELSNCQVLCYSCHKEKTTLERYVDHPHGAMGRYKYGCRCDLCKEANNVKSRAWRAKRKNA